MQSEWRANSRLRPMARVLREAPPRNGVHSLFFFVPFVTASATDSLRPKRKTSKAPRGPGRSREANFSRSAVYPNARLCARTYPRGNRVDFSRGRRGHGLSPQQETVHAAHRLNVSH